MFDPSDGKPRVFGLPPGADFPRAIAAQLARHYDGRPPEALARVRIFANAARMRRRLTECLSDGTPRLLPRISLVSDLVPLVPEADLPPQASPLERQLEMARLLKPLLESPSAPAPRSALYDLADSLIALLDEMHTEGVAPEAVLNLDTEGAPRHWEQAQQFLAVVQRYIDATRDAWRDAGARQRAALGHLLERWRLAPPDTPVLVVGSTGSRGTTFELMRAVASLPQGAVVLPGFDHDMPAEVWEALDASDPPAEDHAQYRFKALCDALGVAPMDVKPWAGKGSDTARNALISLALRPAPVTDQWLRDGPGLGDLTVAANSLSLIRAPQPRDEAGAIAVAIRDAVERGRSVALVTPDRTLARRVAAALRRWSIVPDDSAGMPLSLSPPGRFLRQIAELFEAAVDPAALIALLRHPLTRTGGSDRGQHSLWTDALELELRRAAIPVVTPDFVTKPGDFSEDHGAWRAWLADRVGALGPMGAATLADYAARHVAVAEAFARGGAVEGAGALWDERAGELARAVMDRFADPSISDEPMVFRDYRRLLEHALARENLRQTDASRPDVQILGTLEARVLGADTVILGGLNEGVWPGATPPDAWLSRRMRRTAGLLSPERQIGLSAHDFQQAAAAPEVVLSRASRNEEAETVPSRWLNRLTNLLGGLPDQGGMAALEAMIARGDRHLAVAAALDAPRAEPVSEPRPAPAPPSSVRPHQLSVTTIEKLIRDPYWIYARHILRLKPLKRLAPEPDAALRGEVFHKVVERFVYGLRDEGRVPSVDRFVEIARDTLDARVPWPATRRLWLGHLEAIAPRFVNDETIRQMSGRNLATEVRGRMDLAGAKFVITGEADRIDMRTDGTLVIYDYKSGSVPTDRQALAFNPQIPIEALMAERGAFHDVPATSVGEGVYLSLGRSGKQTPITIGDHVITLREKPVGTIDFSTAATENRLVTLLTAYAEGNRGYVSRRAMERVRFEGDFDHLARFGEWDETLDPEVIRLP